MCFSAEASIASGVLLMPVGAYCTVAALRKNISYLPLALTPILFGVQQLCEAGVWLGFERNDPALVKPSATAFLFFAIAFWPCWIPFVAMILEPRSWRRKFFFLLMLVGMWMGGGAWLEAVLKYDELVHVGIAGHSIRYDLTQLTMAQSVASALLQVIYLVLICGPLILSHERGLLPIGVLIGVSAVTVHFVFMYAFVSVWCFFASLISAHIGYVIYRLPTSQ